MADMHPNRIGRREILAGGVIGLGVLLAPPAQACSLTGVRRVRFDDDSCRQALRDWVHLLNSAPKMSEEAVEAKAEALNVTIDDELLEDNDSVGAVAFYRQFRLADGRLDPRAIRISEIHLLRQLRNRAAYQFELERYSYHAADPEGCNGMFVHDEYFGIERSAYVASFNNNKLDSIRTFPEWPLEEKA
jgi:hypothetical protein